MGESHTIFCFLNQKKAKTFARSPGCTVSVELDQSGCWQCRVWVIPSPRSCLLPASLAARCPPWLVLPVHPLSVVGINKVTLRRDVLPELIFLQRELEHRTVRRWPWQTRLLVTLKPGTWNLMVFPRFHPRPGVWNRGWGSAGSPASPDLTCVWGTAAE